MNRSLIAVWLFLLHVTPVSATNTASAPGKSSPGKNEAKDVVHTTSPQSKTKGVGAKDNLSAEQLKVGHEYIVYAGKRVRESCFDIPKVSSSRKTFLITVLFHVSKNGTLSGIHVTKTSGDKDLDATIVRAVTLSNPLRPPPSLIEDDGVDLQITFDTRTFAEIHDPPTSSQPAKEVLPKGLIDNTLLLVRDGKTAAFQQRDEELAIEKFRSALKIAPPELHSFVAHLLADALDRKAVATHDPVASFSLLSEAILLVPSDELFGKHLDASLTKQNIDANSYEQRLKLANELAAKKEIDSALVEYQAASRLLKSSKGIAADLAQAKNEAVEGENKMSTIKHARDDEQKWRDFQIQHPSSPDGAMGLATALEKQGNIIGAIEVLKKAVELAPEYFNLKQQLQRLEKLLPDDAKPTTDVTK